jgi:hypothetical protein
LALVAAVPTPNSTEISNTHCGLSASGLTFAKYTGNPSATKIIPAR